MSWRVVRRILTLGFGIFRILGLLLILFGVTSKLRDDRSL